MPAEQSYGAMRNVAFPSDSLLPNSANMLYTMQQFAENVSACSQLCLRSKNVGWPQPDGTNITLNCTLWRYCQDIPGGCPSQSPSQYRPLNARICQLMSFYSLDLGFAQGPFSALGSNKTFVSGSILGAPPSPCLLPA